MTSSPSVRYPPRGVPTPELQLFGTANGTSQRRGGTGRPEVDGRTRVLLRHSYAGPDGLPVVLEDRVYTAFASDDPAWETLFTEAMSGARFRCSYLNAEESAG